MKILITGATGFVGRHLIPKIKDGNEIDLVVRNISKAQSVIGNNWNFISLDNLSNISHVKYDVVVHLAAYLTSKEDDESLERIFDSNILFGTKILKELSNNPPSLFVNFGTFAEYRFGPQEIHNAYLYSASKSAFREILRYYSEKFNFKYINVIPYTIYGGKDTQKKVIDVIKDSLDSPKALSMSEGNQILDFIHVNDVVSFLFYIVENKDFFESGKFIDYHLGTGKGTSLREIAKLIESKTGRKCNIKWGSLPYRKNDVMYAVAPQGPLIECGWKSTYNLHDSL